VEHGLLVSADQIENVLIERAAGQMFEEPAIRTLVIMTSNRPTMLRRSLASCVENLQRFGRQVRVLVVDDSEPAPTAAAIAAVQSQCDLAIEYFGNHETRLLERRLRATGDFDPEVIRFALFGQRPGQSWGANRNRALLTTVGQRLISIDDDVVCRLLRHGEPQGRLFLESSDQAEHMFFRSRAEALSHLANGDEDLVGVYDRVLGRHPATLLSEAGRRSRIAGLTLEPRVLDRLLHSKARIRYCMPGLAGDCATWAPSYLTLSGRSRERLVGTQDIYRWARQTREVVRCVPAATVAPVGFCMAYAVGLDNTTLLPPFLPLLRNEDGLFAHMLGLLEPRAFYAALPYAIMHDPEEIRSFGAADIANVMHACRLSDVVLALARQRGNGGSDPCVNLRRLGEHLRHIAAAPLPDFEDTVRTAVRPMFERRLALLDRLLVRYRGTPRFWAEDAHRALDGLQAAIGAADPLLPLDLKSGLTDAECRSSLRATVMNMGRLLESWEGMRDACRDNTAAAAH